MALANLKEKCPDQHGPVEHALLKRLVFSEQWCVKEETRREDASTPMAPSISDLEDLQMCGGPPSSLNMLCCFCSPRMSPPPEVRRKACTCTHPSRSRRWERSHRSNRSHAACFPLPEYHTARDGDGCAIYVGMCAEACRRRRARQTGCTAWSGPRRRCSIRRRRLRPKRRCCWRRPWAGPLPGASRTASHLTEVLYAPPRQRQCTSQATTAGLLLERRREGQREGLGRMRASRCGSPQWCVGARGRRASGPRA
jgi:hypothetical protein